MYVTINQPVFGLLNGETVQILGVTPKMDSFKLLKVISHTNVIASSDEFNMHEITTNVKEVNMPLSPQMDTAFQIIVDAIDEVMVPA